MAILSYVRKKGIATLNAGLKSETPPKLDNVQRSDGRDGIERFLKEQNRPACHYQTWAEWNKATPIKEGKIHERSGA